MTNVQALKHELSIQQWKAIIEDRITSGLTIEEYCKKNQLSRNSYFYWLRRIREEMASTVFSDDKNCLPASAEAGTLVELVPSPGVNAAISKIELPCEVAGNIDLVINGIGITVDSGISEVVLSKIMRAARNA